MKELDVVKLKTDFRSITAGTEGTIVLEYDGTAFEVEFFDKDKPPRAKFDNFEFRKIPGKFRFNVEK